MCYQLEGVLDESETDDSSTHRLKHLLREVVLAALDLGLLRHGSFNAVDPLHHVQESFHATLSLGVLEVDFADVVGEEPIYASDDRAFGGHDPLITEILNALLQVLLDLLCPQPVTILTDVLDRHYDLAQTSLEVAGNHGLRLLGVEKEHLFGRAGMSLVLVHC